jgi:hypothetical protein
VSKRYLLFPFCAVALLAQTQHFYNGTNVTGQLLLIRSVNLTAQAQAAVQSHAQAGEGVDSLMYTRILQRERFLGRSLEVHPSQRYRSPVLPDPGTFPFSPDALTPSGPSLTVSPSSSSFGFAGLTHYDQRNANGGNQLSLEPPSPAVAAGDGYVLEGVNNAIQVYTSAGTPLLPVVVSTNQLFGVSPAIDRSTFTFGVYPTDMRAFYDANIDRWFVLQRSAANDAAGNPLPKSQYLLAVSQTGDPTQMYNIYTFDTTNLGNFRCPCISDYPEIGADQYGFYISANEFNASTSIDALQSNILAISKTALAAGSIMPTAVKFEIPSVTGYEFTIQPSSTPPGASNFLANGGVEYFVSSMKGTADANLSIWAMNNTGSLGGGSPTLLLTQTTIPTETYSLQNNATQKLGPLTLAKTFFPTGLLEALDGGDIRVLSVSYAGGRLYVTLGTQVIDSNSNALSGGAYFVISPDLRAGVLSGATLRQGYLVVDGNHLLRPSIAVNAQGNGAIVFTLVGPNYFPSAAFVPFSNFAPSGPIQVAGPGAFPEDGFTGYPNSGFPVTGVARWGDYSSAIVDPSGSIWMTTEYIPNSVRTSQANWGTYVMQYIP